MLNSKGERELVYIVEVDDIVPMNADRLECAIVGGWKCVVGKGEFHKGDKAVYFEIDSKLPEVEPFASMEFLASKHFKIKSQKIRGVVSQGLLMPVSAFGWYEQVDGTVLDPAAGDHGLKDIYGESRFLTKELGVTYAVSEDNKRKANGPDKYKAMAQRHHKLFKHYPFKWFMRYEWGRKFMFLLFGKKNDKKKEWPEWVVKTDEERCQNLRWSDYAGTGPWIVTEKLDGTSTTFTMRKVKNKYEYLVCSRNVVFNKPDKNCYYDTNVYTEMSEKYDVENVLRKLFNNDLFAGAEWITLQGETYGAGIQKRDYSLNEHRFAGFNLISSVTGRIGTFESKQIMEEYGIQWVPTCMETIYLPETVDELLLQADGASQVDGQPREGFVLRSLDGKQSFKAVSNNFLLKYHQ